jgi:hypothetical protein
MKMTVDRNSRRRLILSFIIALVVTTVAILLLPSKVYASSSFAFEDGNEQEVVLNTDGNGNVIYYDSYSYVIYANDWIENCDSSNPEVATVERYEDSWCGVHLNVKKIGQTTITAENADGDVATCLVTIKPPEFWLFRYSSGMEGDDSTGYTSVSDTYWGIDINDGYGNPILDFCEYWYYDDDDELKKATFYHVDSSIAGTKYTSNNPSVATVDSKGIITPKKIGSTTVKATDVYGRTINIPVNVSFEYYLDKDFGPNNFDTYGNYYNMKYGSGKITGKTLHNASVTVTLKGKKYSGTANGAGNYTIKVPKYIKIGTKFTVKASAYGGTITRTRKVVTNNPTVLTTKVFRKTKKMTVTLKNVHKGDYVAINVAGKKYKKKITKDAATKKYIIKLKSNKSFGGSKVKVVVYNKYKQKLRTHSKPIYYASKIKRGFTKKQVKFTTGWGPPENIDTYGKYTTWWYGDYSRYVYFYNGNVTGWGY